MIFASEEILSGPRKKRKYTGVTNPGKKLSVPINPWDIGKYSKPLTEEQVRNVEKTNKLINDLINSEKKKRIDKATESRGFYDEYDASSNVLSYKTKPGQFTDVSLNPVQDFKKFDQAVTNRIRSGVTELVTENVTEPAKNFIDNSLVEPVKKLFDGWQWYHWALLIAGSLLLIFLMLKGKQVITQYIPWK